ncbi:hypothetical protein E3A20_20070, partial [Planctomyces bekefii]
GVFTGIGRESGVMGWIGLE